MDYSCRIGEFVQSTNIRQSFTTQIEEFRFCHVWRMFSLCRRPAPETAGLSLIHSDIQHSTSSSLCQASLLLGCHFFFCWTHVFLPPNNYQELLQEVRGPNFLAGSWFSLLRRGWSWSQWCVRQYGPCPIHGASRLGINTNTVWYKSDLASSGCTSWAVKYLLIISYSVSPVSPAQFYIGVYRQTPPKLF